MIFLIDLWKINCSINICVSFGKTRIVILESKTVSCVGEISFTASASYESNKISSKYSSSSENCVTFDTVEIKLDT